MVDSDVAVVGVAVQLPGARDVEEYWLDLVRGREPGGATALDAGRLDAVGADRFDAEFFGMTDGQARACDPRTRLFLEIAHCAIENAGYDPQTLRDVGVFASAGPAPAGLGRRGPTVTVLDACASALAGLHRAQQSLIAGDCAVAVVGGAHIEPPDGRCACAVLVKRLADALADRDHISAVIRGIAVDGEDIRGRGAMVRALGSAGLLPEDISYIETDGLEPAALSDAYQRPIGAGTVEPCRIGSVLGNLGHVGPITGMAGLIKTALSLDREQLPPGPSLPSTVFRVQDRLTAWPRDPRRPRRAAVDSVDTGGSRVHVVLEEPPPYAYRLHAEEPRVVVWSGLTEEAERAARGPLARFFTSRGELPFADAVATLRQGRAAHPVRAAAVCTSAFDAATVLRESDAHRIRVGRAVTAPRPVSLMFPGHCSYPIRGVDGLRRAAPAFAATLDDWLDRLDGAGRPPLFAIEVALARLWLDAGVRPAALLGHGVGALAAAVVGGMFTPADAARLVQTTVRAVRSQDRDLLCPVLAAVRPAAPCIPVHSAATGRPISLDDAADPGFWATQLFGPVPSAVATGPGALVEVGPGAADVLSLLSTAARLWTEGHDIAWERIGQAPLSRRVPVPGYAYQRRSLAIDPPAPAVSPAGDRVDLMAGSA